MSLLIVLGSLEDKVLIQGEISTLVFLAGEIAYAVGTVLNWREDGNLSSRQQEF